jgi:hypothetical protein
LTTSVLLIPVPTPVSLTEPPVGANCTVPAVELTTPDPIATAALTVALALDPMATVSFATIPEPAFWPMPILPLPETPRPALKPMKSL